MPHEVRVDADIGVETLKCPSDGLDEPWLLSRRSTLDTHLLEQAVEFIFSVHHVGGRQFLS